MSFWDEEKEKKEGRLRELTTEDLSAQDIANKLNEEFGSRLTRNTIIGKLRRLGVPLKFAKGAYEGPRKTYTSNRKVTVRPPKLPKPKVAKVLAMLTYPVPDLAAADSMAENPVSLFDVKEGQCRWVIGESKEMMFCGNAVVPIKGYHSWCPAHCMIGLHHGR